MSKRLKIGLVFGILVIIIAGLGIGISLWRKKLKLRAELTFVCQEVGPKTSFYGPAGHVPLVTVNFAGHQVPFHPKAAPYLVAVSQEITERKINYSFENVQTFNPASVSDYGPSFHAFGLAIDINPNRNPMTSHRPPTTDLPPDIINIFKKYGFGWGGDWQYPVDPMHFEWYGGGLTGSIIAENTGQKISKVKMNYSGVDLGSFNENFQVFLPAGTPVLSAWADGFYSQDFQVVVPCNAGTAADIKLKPVAKGAVVTLSGKIDLPGNLPLTGFADIYVDGIYQGKTNEKGEFFLTDVPSGMIHSLEARYFPLFKGFVQTNIKPGEDKTNIIISLKTAGL